jgi:hypothetical protein
LRNVELTKTEKEYKNAFWHVSYYFEIDDIIRKNNREMYKDKVSLLNCQVKILLMTKNYQKNIKHFKKK